MSGILMMSVGNSYGSLPINTVAPAVTGTAETDQVLSCSTGTWTGSPTPTFTYQWQRATTNISGATSNSYTIQSSDVGSTLRCVVTATNAVGAVSANSANTNVVVPAIGSSFQGGYYSGKIIQGGTTYYLIVAPKATGESAAKLWKTINTSGPSATQTLNNGPDASAAMGVDGGVYPAAAFCEGLSIGGYTDWYMPARDELELLYRNLKPTTASNRTDARELSGITYPEGNDSSGDTMGRNRNSSPSGSAYSSSSPQQTSATAFRVGGSEEWIDDEYNCSSEFSSSQCWNQLFIFYNGFQGQSPKNGNRPVRAVRRVAV